MKSVMRIGWTLAISLNGADYALSGRWDFVWLDNYLRIAASTDFLTALAQTLLFVAAGLALEALIALPVALALHRGVAGSRMFRAVVALPLMVAPVVGALAWRFVFADGYGMIDSAAAWLGGDGPLRIGIEAASGFGWARYLGPSGVFIGMTGFGASAPLKALYAHFGITAEAIVAAAKQRL